MRQKSSCLVSHCQKKTWSSINSPGSMRNIRVGSIQSWSEISDKIKKLKAMVGFGIKIKLSHVAKTHGYTGTRIHFPCTIPDCNYKKRKKKPHNESLSFPFIQCCLNKPWNIFLNLSKMNLDNNLLLHWTRLPFFFKPRRPKTMGTYSFFSVCGLAVPHHDPCS